MIKKFFLTVIAFSVTLISCTSQTRMLKDLPTGDGVTKVVIGPYIMKLAGEYIDDAKDDYNEMFDEIKSIEVYSCENSEIAPEAERAFLELIKDKNVELNITTEDTGEVSKIYTVLDDKTSEPIGMIVYSSDVNVGEVDIVIMTGKMKVGK